MAISAKTIALAAAGLAFVGMIVQLGGLAALTNEACKDSTDGMPVSVEALTKIATGGSTGGAPPPASRRLLGTPSEGTLSARCAAGFGFDW